MTKTVLGIFHSRENTESAITKLEAEGYNPKDLSIIMKDSSEAKEISDNTGVGAVEGAASGALTGAVVGGLAGLVGAFIIPGLGAFLIGGPIAAALGLTGAAASTVSGAATGAVAGGFVGALTGMGLSQEEAETYQSEIKEGAILLAVPARSGEEAEVKTILESFDASEIKTLDASESNKTEATHEDKDDRTHIGFGN